jgi:hypothetical protein
MDARESEERIEVVEPEDVADLGDESCDDGRPDARSSLESPGEFAIEKLADASLSRVDLALEKIEVVEQETDPEGHLGIELWHGYRLGRCGRQADGLGPELFAVVTVLPPHAGLLPADAAAISGVHGNGVSPPRLVTDNVTLGRCRLPP